MGVGGLLAFNYWMAVVRPRQLACAPGEVCYVDSPTMRATRMLFWTSIGIYVAAVGFTYGALWWVRMQQ